MRHDRIGVAAVIALAITLFTTPESVAQSAVNARQVELTRTELDSLLVRYEQTAASSAYSASLREQARRESALIQTRLREGDFQVGDQVELVVEGETTLTGTFTVQAGPELILPEIGRISLAGVLRSELEEHLETELSRFLRRPVVHARSSIRLLISGGVGRAGYYVIPTNAVFTDVLMTAGGPAPTAVLQKIRVERADRPIWEGEALQQAIVEGRTLDQLSIQAGDHIFVPIKGEGGIGNLARNAMATLGSLAIVIVALTQVF